MQGLADKGVIFSLARVVEAGAEMGPLGILLLEEEMLLYDLNSIVSAVGGSLGLFLGFSCFQVALWMASCVFKRITEMCKKYQNKFEESVI